MSPRVTNNATRPPSVAVPTDRMTEIGSVQLSYCATRNRYAISRAMPRIQMILPWFWLS